MLARTLYQTGLHRVATKSCVAVETFVGHSGGDCAKRATELISPESRVAARAAECSRCRAQGGQEVLPRRDTLGGDTTRARGVQNKRHSSPHSYRHSVKYRVAETFCSSDIFGPLPF